MGAAINNPSRVKSSRVENEEVERWIKPSRIKQKYNVQQEKE
jgi:hypothetical protein